MIMRKLKVLFTISFGNVTTKDTTKTVSNSAQSSISKEEQIFSGVLSSIAAKMDSAKEGRLLRGPWRVQSSSDTDQTAPKT